MEEKKMKKKKPQLLRFLADGFISLYALRIIVTSLLSLSSLGILHIPPRSPSIPQLISFTNCYEGLSIRLASL